MDIGLGFLRTPLLAPGPRHAAAHADTKAVGTTCAR